MEDKFTKIKIELATKEAQDKAIDYLQRCSSDESGRDIVFSFVLGRHTVEEIEKLGNFSVGEYVDDIILKIIEKQDVNLSINEIVENTLKEFEAMVLEAVKVDVVKKEEKCQELYDRSSFKKKDHSEVKYDKLKKAKHAYKEFVINYINKLPDSDSSIVLLDFVLYHLTVEEIKEIKTFDLAKLFDKEVDKIFNQQDFELSSDEIAQFSILQFGVDLVNSLKVGMDERKLKFETLKAHVKTNLP